MLSLLVKQVPQRAISVLVRDDTKANDIKQAFSEVSILKGDLDAAETLIKAASEADVVLRRSIRGDRDFESLNMIHRLGSDWSYK